MNNIQEMNDFNFLTKFSNFTENINNILEIIDTRNPKIIVLQEIFIILNRAYGLMHTILIIKKQINYKILETFKKAYYMFMMLYNNITCRKPVKTSTNAIELLQFQIHKSFELENINDIGNFIIHCFTYISNSLKEETIFLPNLITLLREWERILQYYEKTECISCFTSFQNPEIFISIDSIKCNKRHFFCRSCSRIYFPEKIIKMNKHPLVFQNAFLFDFIPRQQLIQLTQNHYSSNKRKIEDKYNDNIKKLKDDNELIVANILISLYK